MAAAPFDIVRLGAADAGSLAQANALFAEVFEDRASYLEAPPSTAYARRLLADDRFILLVARSGGETIGALAAYELVKFERERSEIYIYDLGVAERWRRRGVATALIEAVRRIARECGAWMIFVQADTGDDPAIALYRKLGREERVLHFDIAPAG